MDPQLFSPELRQRITRPKMKAAGERQGIKGWNKMFVLAACMALQMTGYVMLLPLFARRLSEMGAGVTALSESAMAYALAATLAAPFMGALADRFGRRRLALLSLAASLLAFIGYLFAASAAAFIILRGLAGAFTAGLVPAITGLVGDMAPQERRAQWLGIVNGGASVGWIAGPVLGGVLYDTRGYPIALGVSILFTLAALIAAWAVLPKVDQIPAVQVGEEIKPAESPVRDLRWLHGWLPRPLAPFFLVLWIQFAVLFAWAFIEPRFMFYAYDGLGWNSSMLGLVMSVYGVALTLGELGLGRLSDRWGRKTVILLGLVLFSAQFLGMALTRNTLVIASTFILAGLGNALYDPALSASLLDITPATQRARWMGIKVTAGSLGSILGPALIVMFPSSLNVRTIFLGSAGIALMTAFALLPGRRARQKTGEASRINGG